MFPVTFSLLAMPIAPEVVFSCIATMDYFPFDATLLEEYFALVGELETELRNLAFSRLWTRHPKDLVLPWGTPELLFQQC